MYKSIKNRIIVPVTIVLMVTIAGTGFYSFFKTSQLYNKNIKHDYLDSHIEHVSSKVEAIINRAVEVSRLNAEDPSLIQWLRDEEQNQQLGIIVKDRLRVMKEELDYFTSFLVSATTNNYWANGDILLDEVEKSDPDDSWFFSALQMQGKYVLNLDYNAELQDTLLFVNAVIRSEGDNLGITGVGLNINELQERFTEIYLTPNSYVHLINKTGKILISSSEEALGKSIDQFIPQSGEVKIIDKITSNNTSKARFLKVNIGNGVNNIVWRQVGGSSYRVVAVVPESEMVGFIDTIKISTISAVLIALFFSFMVLYVIAVSISSPIKNISHRLEEISKGDADLTTELHVRGKDEVATLSNSFNNFIWHMRELIDNIKEGMSSISYDKNEISTGSNETASAIYEIRRSIESIQNEFSSFNEEIETTASSYSQMSNGIQSLRGEIENQSSAVEETSASIEEMNASINSISKTSNDRKTEAEELVGVVNTMKESMSGIQEDVTQLNQKAEEMVKATEVINNISSKTNLLSMNAAIEAAHAGEAGKGFAVVAEEIRNLADNSAINAKNISNELKGSVQIIHKLDETSAEANEQFNKIEKVAKNTMASFTEIVSTMDELSLGTKEINNAISSLREISNGVGQSSSAIESEIEHVQSKVNKVSNMSEQINGAISEIITGTEQINTAMNELNDNIQDLNSSIDSISSSVERFKT